MSSGRERPPTSVAPWCVRTVPPPRSQPPAWLEGTEFALRAPPPPGGDWMRPAEDPNAGEETSFASGGDVVAGVPLAAHEALQQRFDALAAELAATRSALDLERAKSGGLASALNAKIEEVAGVRREILEASEPGLVALAVAIAERVVGRELRADPSLAAQWAREAVATLGAHGDATILLSPDLAARIPRESWAFATEAGDPVMADEGLPPGSVRVSAGPSTIEAGPRERVASVADDLRAGMP